MSDVDIDAFAQQFVTTYNKPPSNVKEFYSEDLVWFEVPGGRFGGQQDLFDAFDAVRGVLTDLKITEILRTFSRGNIGVLENKWEATSVADGSKVEAILAWVWEFGDDGKIVRQHDYFMELSDPIG